MTQLNKIQIIEETVAYYSEDVSRRAVEKAVIEGDIDQCRYYTEDGKVCAFARVLEDPKSFQEDCDNEWGCQAIQLIDMDFVSSLDIFIKPEYQGHSSSFWRSIQILHDTQDYWNSSGLTEEGETYKNFLMERYKD